MKRYGNLWNKFITKENFYLAWLKTAQGRRKRTDIQRFQVKLESNLEDIRQEVIEGKFTTAKYSTKQIYENGKHRLIYILPLKDRIVHHAINNVIEEIFVRSFISHTFGCIKDRGPILGSYHCRKLCMKYKWCLKTDIRKFYPTVDQEILYSKIESKIKDVKLLKIIKDIVFSFPGGKNCPIGNLTSQLFGNIYLTSLDNYLKHNLKVKNYFRYCDDCVILSNNKEELFIIQKKIKEFVENELKQSMSYSEVFPVKQGVDFLGYRHFKGYTLLRKRTATKFKRAVKHIREGKDNRPFLQQLCTIQSYKGYTKHCYTYNFIRSLNLDTLLKDMTIKEFKNVGPKPEFSMTGTKISILTIIDKPIIVTAWKPCKVKGEDSNKIQFVFAEDEKDKQLHITFTRSKVIERQLQKTDLNDFPFKVTIRKEGNSFYLE